MEFREILIFSNQEAISEIPKNMQSIFLEIHKKKLISFPLTFNLHSFSKHLCPFYVDIWNLIHKCLWPPSLTGALILSGPWLAGPSSSAEYDRWRQAGCSSCRGLHDRRLQHCSGPAPAPARPRPHTRHQGGALVCWRLSALRNCVVARGGAVCSPA